MGPMLTFAGLALLDLLSEPKRQWAASVAQRRTYADGESIHRRGDADTTMCILISGTVRLDQLHADGKPIFGSLIQPGSHFGDLLFYTDGRRTHNASAIGTVQIDHYDEAAYLRLIEDQDVLKAIHRITMVRLNAAIQMADDLRGLPREVHLAKILLVLAMGAGDERRIECVQEDLAALLGTSVMTLAKAVATLKRAGLIETGYRSVRITDLVRMRAWLVERLSE